MLAFDLNMPLKDSASLYKELKFGNYGPSINDLESDCCLKWEVNIWNTFKRDLVKVGKYDSYWEAEQAYKSALEEMVKEEMTKQEMAGEMAKEEMAKEMAKEVKAVFGRAFFGKNDGSISSFQVLLVLENLDDIVSWERLFSKCEGERLYSKAEKTFEQICGDAQLAAVIQRIRNPGTYPSWRDFVHDEEYEAYKEIFEVFDNWITHTRFYMERESRGFVGGKRPWDTRTDSQIPFEYFHYRYRTGPESDHDAGIQNPTDISKIICEDSVRNPHLLDHAVQPGLAKTCAILIRNLLNDSLPICERWTDLGSTMSRTLRNALNKVWSLQSGGPNIVSKGLDFFKSASKLAVSIVLFGSTPAVGAVGAMTPEVAEPGPVQAEDFEKASNFAFGVVACVGTLVTIFALLKSFNCSRRHCIARTSAASATTGAILNRALQLNPPQTLTVLRSWRETEFREVVVARREEEGAYAS